MTALPCPKCKRPPEPDYDGYGVLVACDNCYDADCVGDPAEYVSRSPAGSGLTVTEAIEDWNEQIEMEATT